MNDKIRFYKNQKTNEVRIAWNLTPQYFVVVKLIPGGRASLKVWTGTSLDRTASYWNTKPYVPKERERRVLTHAAHRVALNAFKALSTAYQKEVRTDENSTD